MAQTLQFTKMNGAGNDFVLVDNRTLTLDLSARDIERLCHRQRGVGADGLLAVEPAAAGSAAQYRFRYYNADGGEVEMCGNGARCFARFINRLHGFSLQNVTFDTIAGQIGAEFIGDEVQLAMSTPHSLFLSETLPVNGRDLTVHFLNTGVPHAVVFVEDLEQVDVLGDGAALRYHDRFSPRGTNANFVLGLVPAHISIRTYERGVEGETLACGTGTVACALVHHLLNHPTATGRQSIGVKVRGGETMTIGFTPNGTGTEATFSDVTLRGPAEFVFDGSIAL
jgi:diaminopimelate epimerase